MWPIAKQVPAVFKESERGRFLRFLRRNLTDLLLLDPGFERQVARAIRLQPRGGIRNDGTLPIETVSARIKIVCRARPLHPWDENQPAETQRELFARQCLQDVDNAVTSVFQRLRGVEEIDMTVLAPDGGSKIIAGIISRPENPSGQNVISPGMRLLLQGLKYRLNDCRFEPIP